MSEKLSGRTLRTQEAPYFFPVQKFTYENRHASFFIGCPTSAGFIDYEPTRLHIVTRFSDCSFDPSFQTTNKHFQRFAYDTVGKDGTSREVDGLSGGAVYSLVGETGHWEIVLDGIIVRAGNGHLHIIDSDYLIRFAFQSSGHSP
jgi:hypothetical protein